MEISLGSFIAASLALIAVPGHDMILVMSRSEDCRLLFLISATVRTGRFDAPHANSLWPWRAICCSDVSHQRTDWLRGR